MTLTEFLLAELEREVPRSRRALEQVPEGNYDWRPHEKSMTFGYLADLVATMPAWLAMMISTPDLDIAPADGSSFAKERRETSGALLQALDASAADARAALRGTTEDHLHTTWQLKARGQVVAEAPRHEMIQTPSTTGRTIAAR